MDDESPIIAYSYQVYKQTGDKPGRSNEDAPITPEVRVALSTLEVVVQGLQLQVTT